MAVEYELKCLSVYFDAIARGEKTFDVRRDDRGFQKGDTVRLLRLHDSGSYKDREVERNYSDGKATHSLKREITYILTGGQFGIEPGFVVLALSRGSARERRALMSRKRQRPTATEVRRLLSYASSGAS